jgi:hypothetical protein
MQTFSLDAMLAEDHQARASTAQWTNAMARRRKNSGPGRLAQRE